MKFKQYIKESGESIASLSKKIQIPYATLNEGIKNSSQMKIENLVKLSKYYGLSLDELYSMIEIKQNTFLNVLKDQLDSKLKGNIYHDTQIKFAYNTNRIEGSKLSYEQTRLIFETSTISIDGDLNTDDLIETANSFFLFDRMLIKADQYLTIDMIKDFHRILKNGTNDSRKSWFKVGEFKSLPNEVGGMETTPPKEVNFAMENLFNWYYSLKKVSFDNIIEFHYRFEIIHPFQDGNGRIGRIILFKECLKNNIVPFIIEDEIKSFYYRGLRSFSTERGFLIDTCLSMQDKYLSRIKHYLGDLHPLDKLFEL